MNIATPLPTNAIARAVFECMNPTEALHNPTSNPPHRPHLPNFRPPLPPGGVGL